MATFTNAWDETIPEDNLLTGLSEAGKIDDLIRQMKLDIRERILKFMPVGMVIKWPGPIAPYGFKECNGESLLRADYPDLYALLGTIHGTSDATHFNIPEIRGYFARGWNNSKAAGLFDPDAASRLASTKPGATMTAGDHVGTIQLDENKAHTHVYYSYFLPYVLLAWETVYPYNISVIGNTGSTGDENRPDNIYFKYIIRVDDETPDGSYSYIREWDENNPVGSDYMGRMALEIRKLRTDVQEFINNFFPPGIVLYWPSSLCPDGYLELNGQGLSSTTYPDLYNEIEDIYGPGDGVSTDFNLPDVRGIFIRSHDNGSGIDSLAASRTGGDNVGSAQDDEVKAHTHTYMKDTVFDIFTQIDPAGVGDGTANEVSKKISERTGNSPPRTVDSHPKNMYLMAIIKAKACL